MMKIDCFRSLLPKRKTSCYLRPVVRWLLLVLSLPGSSSAADKLVFGWSAIAGSQAVPWIMKEAGLFEKHGLDTTLIYLDGGSRAIQVLLSGDVPIVQGGGNSPVAARLRGGDVTLIAGIVNVLAYSLIVHPDIKRPEDLRGKKLAISRYGSNSDYATRKILIKWGLKPDTDVAIVQIPGGQPTRLAVSTERAGRRARCPAACDGACAQGASQQSCGAIGLWQRLYEHTHRCYRCLYQRPKGYRPAVHPSFG